MLIVEVERGLNQPAYITSWSRRDVCFYPFIKRSARRDSYLKPNKPRQKRTMPPTHSRLLLHDRMRASPPPCSTPTHQCGCCSFLGMPLTAWATQSLGQPHFASSEYLWMLLGGHIPLSGRLPGMGLPILSPCSRLSGSLTLHPIVVCISPCLAATSAAGVMEKNERQKTVWGKRAASSQVKKKKIYAGGRWMAFSRLQSLN